MFGQMVCMPMNVFAETLARAMQGVQAGPLSWTQPNCGQPAAALCAPAASACATAPCTSIDVARASDCAVECCRDPAHQHGGWHQDGDACCSRDTCCSRHVRHTSGDRLILYEYTLADVGRSRGRVLESGQKLVDSCTSSEQLHNMVIFEYLETHPLEVKPSESSHEPRVRGENLRVFCRQLDSWCKEPWDYEAKQIEVLEGIRRAMPRT
jgi:hypothetical protein